MIQNKMLPAIVSFKGKKIWLSNSWTVNTWIYGCFTSRNSHSNSNALWGSSIPSHHPSPKLGEKALSDSLQFFAVFYFYCFQISYWDLAFILKNICMYFSNWFIGFWWCWILQSELVRHVRLSRVLIKNLSGK
jgi:hypothetical protein